MGPPATGRVFAFVIAVNFLVISSNGNRQQNKSTILTYAPIRLLTEAPSYDYQSTIIFAGDSDSLRWESNVFSTLVTPYAILIKELHDKNELPPRVSCFGRDLILSELLEPLQYGSFRFISQHSFVMIEGSTAEALTAIVEDLTCRKLVKVDRDTFIFYGEPSVLDVFATAAMFSRIAFRHFVYQKEENGILHVVNFCHAQPRVQQLLLDNKECKRRVYGEVLRAAVVAGDHWYQYENFPDGSLKKGRGIYHLMFKECSVRLNFTMRVYPIPGSGSKVNGTWSGGVGELVARKADLAFPLAIIQPRDFAIDYTTLVSWFERVFWVKPSPKKPKADAIIKPLNPNVWLTTVLTIALSIPFLFYFIRKDYVSQAGDQRLHGGFSEMCGHVVDITTRILLEQSTSLRGCTGLRTRSSIFLLAFFSIVISTGYRSKLFFFLTFNEGDPVPRAHSDLAFSDYKLFFRYYAGVAYRYIEKSDDPIHKAMLKGNRLHLEKTTAGCIKKLFFEGRSACMDYGFSGGYTILANATLHNRGLGSAELVKRSVDSDGRFLIIWGFKKRSPLTKIFNSLVRWFHAAGLYDHWLYRDWTEAKIRGIRYLKAGGDPKLRLKLEELEKNADSSVNSLSYNTLLVPLLLVAFGGAIAIISFLVEIILRSSITFQALPSKSLLTNLHRDVEFVRQLK